MGVEDLGEMMIVLNPYGQPLDPAVTSIRLVTPSYSPLQVIPASTFARVDNPTPLRVSPPTSSGRPYRIFRNSIEPLKMSPGYPTSPSPWTLEIRTASVALDFLRNGKRFPKDVSLHVSLRDILPIHFLDYPSLYKGGLELLKERARRILAKLRESRGTTGTYPRETALFYALQSCGNSIRDTQPLLFEPTSSGKYLLVDGHHRLAALVLLVSHGILPPETLETIPITLIKGVDSSLLLYSIFKNEGRREMLGFLRTSHDLRPIWRPLYNHLREKAFIDLTPESTAKHGWIEVMRFDPISRSFLESHGITSCLSDIELPPWRSLKNEDN